MEKFKRDLFAKQQENRYFITILTGGSQRVALSGRKKQMKEHCNIGIIYLTQNQITVVDIQDYEYLNQWKWAAQKRNNQQGYYVFRTQHLGYSDGKKNRKKIYLHRLIVEKILKRELKRKEIIDHINHNSLDNTRSNLRKISPRQNTQNKEEKGTSNFPGVSWDKNRKKWVAGIRINGKKKNLGSFLSERKAAIEYEKECRQLGEELVCKIEEIQ